MDTLSTLLLLVALGIAIALVTALMVANRRHVWKRLARRLALRYTAPPPRVTGNLGNRPFELSIAGRSSDTGLAGVEEVRMRLGLHGRLPAGFYAMPGSGAIGQAAKTIDREVIETGDESFDREVLLHGEDRHGVLAYLTPRRKEAIRTFLRLENCEPEIDDAGLCIWDREMRSRFDVYEKRIDMMQRVAADLDAG